MKTKKNTKDINYPQKSWNNANKSFVGKPDGICNTKREAL
jgi:hypothetical protein